VIIFSFLLRVEKKRELKQTTTIAGKDSYTHAQSLLEKIQAYAAEAFYAIVLSNLQELPLLF